MTTKEAIMGFLAMLGFKMLASASPPPHDLRLQIKATCDEVERHAAEIEESPVKMQDAPAATS